MSASPLAKERLYAPGPVEVPPQVLAALARPVPHHRSQAFRELFMRTRARLSELFCVEGEDVLIVTGSGTAGFEAAVFTALPQPSRVLALSAGKFGQRWAQLAARLGHEVSEFTAPAGDDFDLPSLRSLLAESRSLDAVTVVHSETSTGVLHDVEAVAGTVRETHPEALVIVDAVTSLAAAELRPLAWGLDAVVSGSQKGVMTPPGLAFVWLSQRTWSRGAAAEAPGASGPRTPGYYLDLRRELPKQRAGETAFTPAVSLVAGLDAALELLSAAGLKAVVAHRAALNAALLAAGKALGMRSFARPASPAVAALRVPDGVSASAVVAAARRRQVTIAGGQDELRDVIVRPSLLGWCDRYDAVVAATALEDALREVAPHLPHARGAAATAALSALDEATSRAAATGDA